MLNPKFLPTHYSNVIFLIKLFCVINVFAALFDVYFQDLSWSTAINYVILTIVGNLFVYVFPWQMKKNNKFADLFYFIFLFVSYASVIVPDTGLNEAFSKLYPLAKILFFLSIFTDVYVMAVLFVKIRNENTIYDLVQIIKNKK